MNIKKVKGMMKMTATRRKKIKLQTILPYLYISPMIILLLVFSGWPFLEAVKTSFYRNDGAMLNEFIGFKNYIDILFHDRMFWISMRNLFYLFLGMNVCFCAPIIAAKLTYSILNKRVQFFIRSAFTIATVVPSVVMMMLWKFIYYPNIGLVARVVQFFGGQSPNLLGNPETAILAVIMIGFPWVTGLSYLMYFAGLQGIDESLMEAARIDGANSWQTFFRIELPMLKPMITSLYVLAFIGQFQDFERFLILTDGGPDNATLLPALYMYKQAFGDPTSSQYGYACAIAMILFVITFALSMAFQKKEEE